MSTLNKSYLNPALFLIFVSSLAILSYVFKDVFNLLTTISPFLLLITIVIDRTVIFNYVRWLESFVKYKILLILTIGLSFAFSIFIIPYLFIQVIYSKYFYKVEGADIPPRFQSQQAGTAKKFESRKHGFPALVSFFIPGLGQLIKGHFLKGFFIWSIGGTAILIFSFTIILIPFAFIIWIWNVYDAYNSN